MPLEEFTIDFYKKFTSVEIQGIIFPLPNIIYFRHTLKLEVLHMLLETSGGYGFTGCESTTSLLGPQPEVIFLSWILWRETSDFGMV